MHAEKAFDEVQPRAFGEGTYVRVTGILKPTYKDSSHGSFMMAFSVKPITSFNEVSRHALEVMRAHLKLKQSRSFKESATSSSGTYEHVTSRALYFTFSLLLNSSEGAYDLLILINLRV